MAFSEMDLTAMMADLGPNRIESLPLAGDKGPGARRSRPGTLYVADIAAFKKDSTSSPMAAAVSSWKQFASQAEDPADQRGIGTGAAHRMGKNFNPSEDVKKELKIVGKKKPHVPIVKRAVKNLGGGRAQTKTQAQGQTQGQSTNLKGGNSAPQPDFVKPGYISATGTYKKPPRVSSLPNRTATEAELRQSGEKIRNANSSFFTSYRIKTYDPVSLICASTAGNTASQKDDGEEPSLVQKQLHSADIIKINTTSARASTGEKATHESNFKSRVDGVPGLIQDSQPVGKGPTIKSGCFYECHSAEPLELLRIALNALKSAQDSLTVAHDPVKSVFLTELPKCALPEIDLIQFDEPDSPDDVEENVGEIDKRMSTIHRKWKDQKRESVALIARIGQQMDTLISILSQKDSDCKEYFEARRKKEEIEARKERLKQLERRRLAIYQETVRFHREDYKQRGEKSNMIKYEELKEKTAILEEELGSRENNGEILQRLAAVGQAERHLLSQWRREEDVEQEGHSEARLMDSQETRQMAVKKAKERIERYEEGKVTTAVENTVEDIKWVNQALEKAPLSTEVAATQIIDAENSSIAGSAVKQEIPLPITYEVNQQDDMPAPINSDDTADTAENTSFPWKLQLRLSKFAENLTDTEVVIHREDDPLNIIEHEMKDRMDPEMYSLIRDSVAFSEFCSKVGKIFSKKLETASEQKTEGS